MRAKVADMLRRLADAIDDGSCVMTDTQAQLLIEQLADRPMSKIALRLSCLKACGNDVRRAGELYGFLAEGLDLPDADPVPLSRVEMLKQGADEVIGWIGGHRDELATGLQFLRGVAAKVTGEGGGPPPGVPPIPKI